MKQETKFPKLMTRAELLEEEVERFAETYPELIKELEKIESEFKISLI